METQLDYPSQRSGLQVPGGPILLDTCVLQNLKYVMGLVESDWLDAESEDEILRRYPGALGAELVALADVAAVQQSNGPPWVVSETSLAEFAGTNGTKGRGLRTWWRDWADYVEACFDGGWYPELDVGDLSFRRGPEVADGQLALFEEPSSWPLSPECVPPFGPFRDAGDRALIRDAVRAGIPTILTTDLKSFWSNRHALFPLGIEIWRPSDLWRTLCHEQTAVVARWRAFAATAA